MFVDSIDFLKKCFRCVLRLGDCLLCHGSGEVCLHLIVSLFLNSLTMGTAAEVVASDILVGAQPRIRWRVEDATRVGLQFPFRPERRGRGAPIVAMKWRNAVKAAIMHGLGGRCHSRCADLVATWIAIVTTRGLHGASAAEAQTRQIC